MQVNKIILFLLLPFQSFNLYAQPDLDAFTINVEVVFFDKKGDVIDFSTNDSIVFSSKCDNYKVQMFRGNYQYGASAREIKIRNTYSSKYDSSQTEKFIFSDSVFKFHLFRVNVVSLITQIKFTYQGEVMFIYLDFNKSDFTEKEYKNKKIKICFKKGMYEIRNPENPKLIPIKEDVIFINNE